MKKSIRAAAAAMLIPILLTLTGCSLTVDGVMSVIAPTETPVPGSDLVFSDAPEVTPEPRQIAYEKMDGVFSPFFAETDGDKAVAEMTQLSLRAVEGNRARRGRTERYLLRFVLRRAFSVPTAWS